MADLLEHALAYAGFGLEIFPVHPAGPNKKRPLLSQHLATLELDQIEEWWDRWPNALIGHRISPGVVLLDIDPRHDGKATWAAIKASLNGDLPTTRTHYSGRGDGGGHVWFQRPRGSLSATGLDQWAKAHGHGQEIAEGRRWTSGIDLLTHEHRYTILPPSPHPDTDRPYRWGAGRGLSIEPATMPRWLVDLIVRPEPTEAPTPRGPAFIDPDSIADWFSSTHTFAQVLRPHGWTIVGGDGEADGSEWVHPRATTSVSATVRHHNLFVYSTSTVFEPTEPDRPRGYTPFAAWALLEHAGDQRKAGKRARELKRQMEGYGVTQMLTPDPQEAPTPSSDTPASPTEAPGALELVDLDDFWGMRPVLGLIRDFARARRCSPWAMFGIVLARLAAATPPHIVLPPLVGGHLSLNVYVCLVGASGAGKDASINAGKHCMDFSAGIPFRTIGLGSGEGILDQYVEYKPPDKDSGEPAGVIQHNDSVLFTNPEIETIQALKGRSSSTLMPMLRDAWMGSELGFAYANRERRLSVAQHKYRLCLILGAQPTSADVLLDEAGLGTPQRFIWLPVDDPKAPDVAPPEPEMPDWRIPVHFETVGGLAEIEVCAEAEKAIVGPRLARLRGEAVEGPSGHDLATREKVAALLAILDGRMDLSSEDWAIADRVSQMSNRTREAAGVAVSTEQAKRNFARGAAEAQRKVQVQATSDSEAIAKASRRILAVLGKHEDGMPQNVLHRDAGARHRPYIPEALETLEMLGQVRSEQRYNEANKSMGTWWILCSK